MAFPYIIQGKNIVVVIGNVAHTVANTHLCYGRLVDAIKAEDWDLVQDLIEPKKVVLKYGQGNVAIEGERLFWKGAELHNSLAARIVTMFQEGFPIGGMIAFMENLMSNPSRRAVNELYGFLEKGELPITPDGHFLAYKRVRDTYMDVHSNTVLNKPAGLLTAEELAAMPIRAGAVTVTVEDGLTTITMERNQVDDDRNRTCSEGLHFCSQHYLNHFVGSRIMILKINPRDVVSIPADYNDSKGRACRYQVVGELGADDRLEGTFNADYDTAPADADDGDDLQPAGLAITDNAGTPVQEYDRWGRPLSMTRDAIRKRLARREGRY